MGNYSEAIKYLKEDIRISLQNELSSAMNSYISMMKIYSKLHQTETAYHYLDSAHQILKSFLAKDSLAFRDYLNEAFEIHTNLGMKYFKEKDYVKASQFYNEAFKLNDIQVEEEKANQIKKLLKGLKLTETRIK